MSPESADKKGLPAGGSSPKGAVGRAGEDAVCRYLMEHGHTVLDRNWRTGHLEIDIVTLFSDGIHFVEVKSRTAPSVAPPEANAGRTKMLRITRAANAWMARHKELGGNEIFLDVATVLFDRGISDINYYPSAYIPLFL